MKEQVTYDVLVAEQTKDVLRNRLQLRYRRIRGHLFSLRVRLRLVSGCLRFSLFPFSRKFISQDANHYKQSLYLPSHLLAIQISYVFTVTVFPSTEPP